MRIKLYTTTILLVLMAGNARSQKISTVNVAQLLPDAIGDFHAISTTQERANISETETSEIIDHLNLTDAISISERKYQKRAGQSVSVLLVRTASDAVAYALFTQLRARAAGTPTPVSLSGSPYVVAAQYSDRMEFWQGSSYLVMRGADANARLELTTLLAGMLDKGEGEIPALVKHLPNWESMQSRVVYTTNSEGLLAATLDPEHHALSNIDFSGGTEAVVADYSTDSIKSRLVVIEYATPQASISEDQRITALLESTVAAGRPLPTAYKRTGNYSVFAFSSAGQEAAEQLADTIKYEKQVRWLGNNPHDLERAQAEYGAFTASVIITTFKATALVLLFCFGIGAIFGGIVFIRRRAEIVNSRVYSDAGGMIRLNIDGIISHELAPVKPRLLIGKEDE